MLKVLSLMCLAVLCLTLVGCPPVCKPTMARCQGSIVQVCRPDKKWQKVLDCSKMGGGKTWNCNCDNPTKCGCKGGQLPFSKGKGL